MKQLENIDIATAKSLLSSMRTYADMSKKLGNRGKELFLKNLSGKQSLTVEYFPALGEDSAWAQAQGVFKRSFSIDVLKDTVIFVPNESLKGGMKVYCDDNMVDLSFKKVEDLMQK